MFKGQIPAPIGGSPLLSAPESLRIKQLEEQASALRNSVICAFNQLLDLKDLNTGVHSTRLAEWGIRVGQELGLEEVALQNLEVAALLHDIGKVGIPDSILRKPSRLDDQEYALMKKHPEYGWAVLRMLPGFERAALDPGLLLVCPGPTCQVCRRGQWW
jgi:HD-GYP domain-containing protein (c-di-GMP phosphodiesterase class II)